jgi:16S rRNA C967 or C1407 C5-methylase (RsmB/RsmF family)
VASRAYPNEFEKQMKATLGHDAPAFFMALDQEAVVSIRKHPLKGNIPYLNESPLPWCAGGYLLSERPVFTLDPHFHGGGYYVQEPSGMILHHVFCQLVKEKNNLVVIDLCAAPGGKSCMMLDAMNYRGILLANEIHPQRYHILNENLEKWGYHNYISTQAPTHLLAQSGALADCVIVDAPCSGEGLFRKDAYAIEQWSEGLQEKCHLMQKDILLNAWELCKPGGHIVYSTCTYNPVENLRSPLITFPEGQYTCIAFPEVLEAGFVLRSDGNFFGYQAYPHRLRGEGFFFSVIQKNPDQYTSVHTGKKQPFHFREDHNVPVEEYCAFDGCKAVTQDGVIFHVTHTPELFEMLHRSLHVPCHVPAYFQYLKNKYQPCHAMAMHTHRVRDLQHIDLSKEEALSYLSREEIPPPNLHRGYYVIRYDGTALGWVNHIGTRMNNMYPREYRIRMKWH